ncbi:hypothetical protein Y032_0009g814 [Ancylostoma ceylanicum]|uniref:Endonuclease/exonuclease/phosphatase domain-containing protein n=1 Tax=Ancylostoma ceylanicum TaxID=53326 RepID=A0A016VJL9_9BILA|nr:hypothetical protein Y032_0009g814 [Ancylostoma ceylanicum]
MDLEKFYREYHTFYTVIVGDFNAKIGPRRTPEELHIGTHGLRWNEQGEALRAYHDDEAHPCTLVGFWEDTVVDNIDEEYEWLIEHLHDSAKKAEGLGTTKRGLSHETLELIRQRGAARAETNSLRPSSQNGAEKR